MKRKILIIIISIFVVILYVVTKYYLYPKYKKSYSAKDFGIEVIKSQNDTNNNGIDDYTDILNGARMDAKNHPKYKSVYYSGDIHLIMKVYVQILYGELLKMLELY